MTHFELYPFKKNRFWNAHSEWDKELEKFFDVFSRSDYYAPACEIIDGEKHFTIGLDIPGLRKDEIEIEVKDNHLHITGERKGPQESVLRSERRYGKFSRVFSLPQNINADAIEARFENGVLEIRLPKEEKSQTKKIAISDWGDSASDLKS